MRLRDERDHAGSRRVKPSAPPLRYGRSGDTPATGVVLGNCAERKRPALERTRTPTTSLNRSPSGAPSSAPASNIHGPAPRSRRAPASKDADRLPERSVASSAVKTDHRIRFSGTGQRAQESCHPTQVEGPAVTVIDGNQRMARVRESGRGSGVEVTERDEAVIDSTARSQHDRGSNLHPRCRTRGVSSPRVPIYAPSHMSPYTAVSAKSLHINQIPTQHHTPRCRSWVQGGRWGATPRKTAVLRPRQVFLRHTCRAGSLPNEISFQEEAGKCPALANAS